MAKEKDKQSTKLFVVAIDFGTTYSGYAFGSKEDWKNKKVHSNTWSGGSLLSHKAPTALLLNSNQEFVAFGYEAEDEYAEIAENGEHEDYYYFHQFKMILNEGSCLSRKTLCEDILGKTIEALKVFAHCVRYLKEHMLEAIQKAVVNVTDKDIHYVMTVPAIWSDKARQFMREAAVQGGIDGKRLTIALEPEAASIYCQHLPVQQANLSKTMYLGVLKPGTTYVVCDLGGGTADITVHQKCDDETLKELCPASGGPWGGKSVDEAFLNFLTEIVGRKIMDNFKKENMDDYIELCRTFELRKRSLKTVDEGNIFMNIPIALIDEVKKDKTSVDNAIQLSQHARKVSFTQGKLKWSSTAFKEFFKDTTDKIVNHLSDMFQDNTLKDAKSILMVGGFSECALVQQAIRENFTDKKIIVPQESGLAVLKGAVYFGFVPGAVSCRTSQYTYGIQSWPEFNPSLHAQFRKVMIDGSPRCKDVFFPFVRRGEHIKTGHCKSHIFKVLNTGIQQHCCAVYISNEKNPKYTDEIGCKKLGDLVLPLPGVQKNEIVECEETMIFGDTELKVIARESHSNNSLAITIDLLSD